MANLTPPQTTASKLRALLAQKDDIIVCPGVYDGFTARLALNAGFKILYMVTTIHIALQHNKEGTNLYLDRSRNHHVPPRHGRFRSGNYERHA
jgi:hypothetical protein